MKRTRGPSLFESTCGNESGTETPVSVARDLESKEVPQSLTNGDAARRDTAAIGQPGLRNPAGPGRPRKVPAEGAGAMMASTTVRFYQADLDFLDDQITAIKRRGGDKTLTRSEVIRAVLTAIRKRGVALSRAQSEAGITAYLYERLRR